jgi:hypothetical protein
MENIANCTFYNERLRGEGEQKGVADKNVWE